MLMIRPWRLFWHMRERASGESKLAGKKALVLVLTVIGTLFAYRRVRGRS